MPALSYRILEQFRRRCPLFEMMMTKCDHNVSALENNQYHLEGSVWTHTMMVYNYLANTIDENDEHAAVLFTAALLHDIGKMYVRKLHTRSDGKRIARFAQHENLSLIVANNVIHTEFNDYLTDKQKALVLGLVVAHQRVHVRAADNTNPVESTVEMIEKTAGGDRLFAYLLGQLMAADTAGRIGITRHDVEVAEAAANILEQRYRVNWQSKHSRKPAELGVAFAIDLYQRYCSNNCSERVSVAREFIDVFDQHYQITHTADYVMQITDAPLSAEQLAELKSEPQDTIIINGPLLRKRDRRRYRSLRPDGKSIAAVYLPAASHHVTIPDAEKYINMTVPLGDEVDALIFVTNVNGHLKSYRVFEKETTT